MSEIRLDRVTFGYTEQGRHKVLRDLDAVFDSEHITVLTGPSGCGKSTLLYLAAGIYPQNAGFLTQGRVTVDGADPGSLAPNERCALVGMMFQNPELQFCMDTVENELIFCLENGRTPREEMDGRIAEALDFCGIPHLAGRKLSTLSGGEKQKAMLACLVLLRPRWLLLDEPFANIDDATAGELVQKFVQLHRTYGTGILAIDHRLDNWLPIADEVRLMDREGTLSPAPIRPGELSPEDWAGLGVIAPGCPYQPARPAKTPGIGAALSLRDVTLSLGGQPVLRGVNASFVPGRIYAIVGPSGSGKSSLFGALSGLYRYGGSILLDGLELAKHRRSLIGRIGFVTQSPQDQFVADTVFDEVALSLRHRKKPGDVEADAEAILRGIRLWRYRRLSPYMLSQGQQRRLGVAALLAYDCRVLVCDEPTYAQDRRNTAAIMEALQREVLVRGITLILSTHDRQLALDYADTILELREGRLCEVAQPVL